MIFQTIEESNRRADMEQSSSSSNSVSVVQDVQARQVQAQALAAQRARMSSIARHSPGPQPPRGRPAHVCSFSLLCFIETIPPFNLLSLTLLYHMSPLSLI